ncbi:hypothetical protein KQ876_01725 [Mycoplasma sp. CSL7491-lung]|uniref:hypothetical protein n=1 Tax=Mycoplasma sp. CSL7491-lung TaxID=549718 RepID=UPI001C107562|nr:hypothetical protein [Mycoplasma sp. CSL7491-lung]MBU4692925.1 hypothetical protein [Mycoplasma sp. CSL7491-lung]
MRFKTIWFKGLAIVAPLSLTTMAAISCSNNNSRSEKNSNAQNGAKDKNDVDSNNKETVKSNELDQKQKNSTDSIDSKNNEKTESTDTIVTPKPKLDSKEKTNDNHEEVQSDSKVDSEKTESDQKEGSNDFTSEKENPESESKDETIVESKKEDEKDTPTTDEQSRDEKTESGKSSEPSDKDSKGVGEEEETITNDSETVGSQGSASARDEKIESNESLEPSDKDSNEGTKEETKPDDSENVESQGGELSNSSEKDSQENPKETTGPNGEETSSETIDTGSTTSSNDTSDNETIDEEEQNKKNYKEEIDRLKNDITNSKNNITDKTFNGLNEKIEKYLMENNYSDEDTIDTLTSKKAKLELVQNQLTKIKDKFNLYKDSLYYLGIEYSSYEDLLQKIDEKIKLFNEENNDWNSKIVVVDDSNLFNNKGKLLPWSLATDDVEKTNSKSSKNVLYESFLNDSNFLTDVDKTNIKKKLLDITGLKNMLASSLGFNDSYSELYDANVKWIIRKDQLNESKYNQGFGEYKVSNSGVDGLHPRKLENWLIFNSSDRNNELGDQVSAINNKINQLTTQFIDSKKTWEDFKNEQFSDLKSRIDSFKVLIKEGKEYSQNLAKELSEAYYSGLLNLVYLKSYLTITISQLQEVKTNSEEVKALLNKLGVDEEDQPKPEEATE